MVVGAASHQGGCFGGDDHVAAVAVVALFTLMLHCFCDNPETALCLCSIQEGWVLNTLHECKYKFSAHIELHFEKQIKLEYMY